MSQQTPPPNPNPLNSSLTPEDVRRLVIVSALEGSATASESFSAGWLVERAFHLGDRVREGLEAEERGERPRHWFGGQNG